MTEDVSAGRLRLDAYVETTGMTRGAQRRIDAEVRAADLRAKIKTELDTRGTIKAAKEAAAKASAQARVRVQTVVNKSELVRQVKEACAAASTQARVAIRTEIDQSSAATATAAVAAVAANRTAKVGVNADTRPAQTQIEGMRRTQSRNPVSVPVKIDKGALAALAQFSKIPAIVGGLYLLNSAIVTVGGGLVALASSAASAVSTLAVLPNMIGAIATTGASLLIGLSGIGEAVGALSAAEAESATAATDMADAQAAAADRIHQAKDSLRAANEAVEDSEWSLARAHEGVRDAQEGLNDARDEARERIAALNRELRLSAGDEEAAYEALITAKENLQDVKWDKASSDQERRAAERSVKDARRAYNDTKRYRKDLRNEAKEANKEGVSGSDEVEAARDQLRDSIHAEQEAEEALAEARHSAVDAQRALTQAQKAATEVTDQQTAAQIKLDDAFDKLSPAGQRFAKFLFGLRGRWYELRNAVQASLLPPIQRGITKALPLLDTLQDGLVENAEIVGAFIERLGGLFGSDAFNADVASIMKTNNRATKIFLDAMYNLVEVFADIAVVAGPVLLVPFAKWVRQLTKGWQESAKAGRKTGEMAEFFERARKRAALLKDILGNLAETIFNVGGASTKTGDKLLKTFERVTQRWANWTGSEEGQTRMEEFFATAGRVTRSLGRLIAALGKFFTKAGEGAAGPLAFLLDGFTMFVKALTWLISLPGVGKIVGWLSAISVLGGGVGLVAAGLGLMYKNLARLGIIKGITKLWRLFNLSLLGTRIGLGLLWLQTKLVAAGTAIMTGAMAVLRGVMVGMRAAATLMFGPWGIAIAIVVGLFILLYKKVDWFRKAVDWVWGKIVDGFNWVVNGAKKLWDVLFGHSIFPDIAKGFRWFWGIAKRIFGFIASAVRGLGKVFTWLWQNAIKPAWGFIQKAVSLAWNYYYKPILKAIWSALKTLGGVFSWLWKNVVSPVWGGIKKVISTVWGFLRDKVFEPLVNLVKNTIPDAFRSAKDAIGNIWESLKEIASKPIEFIVNTLYNDGLRKMINAIPGVPDLPEVSFDGFARGGVLPGYTPGRDVHRFWSPTGGGLALSGGEGIMVPEWVRAIGRQGVAAMNSAARTGVGALRKVMGGVAGYADGGVVEKKGGGWRSAIGTIKDAIGAIPGMLSRLGSLGGWGPMVLDAAKSVGGDMIQWINDRIPDTGPIPNNPIPNIFDRGGQWLTGTMGLNSSGRTETVFTNQNIVDLTGNLAVLARALRDSITVTAPGAGAGAGAGGALVENLTLVGRDDERRGMLRDAREELRVIQMGGVYASRPR